MSRSGSNSRNAVLLGDVIRGVMRDAEMERQAPLDRVRQAWETVTEGMVARDSRVASLYRGTATIEVKSPPLCAELAQFRARRLLERVRLELKDEPVIKRLRFKLGAW